MLSITGALLSLKYLRTVAASLVTRQPFLLLLLARSLLFFESSLTITISWCDVSLIHSHIKNFSIKMRGDWRRIRTKNKVDTSWNVRLPSHLENEATSCHGHLFSVTTVVIWNLQVTVLGVLVARYQVTALYKLTVIMVPFHVTEVERSRNRTFVHIVLWFGWFAFG